MVAKADPFVQRRLLDLARLDRDIANGGHRRRTLPELAVIADGTQRVDALGGAAVLAATEVGDLDKAGRKLDIEIDAVRARAQRDGERIASGAAPSKDLSNLQHEIQSLARRQFALEDEALELMERREVADAVLARSEVELEQARAVLAAAQARRDDAFADIDDQLGRDRAERATLAGGLPVELLALYERIFASGKIAAAQLRGSRCEACRMDLDRSALGSIHSAPVDAVVRCTECGAILIRS
jgi:uncharacterized protein